MEYNPDIHKQLDSYSDIFDIYLERGKTPEEYSYDPLSQYLQSQVEGYRSQTERDEDLRELVRERLLALFGEILPGVLEIQTAYKRELTMIEEFFNDSSEGRLNRWPELKRWLSYNFPKDVFNAEGYFKALQDNEKSKEQIFDAMRHNWTEAALRMKDIRQKNHILRHLRKGLIGIGRQDYETRKKLRSILYKYPALDDNPPADRTGAGERQRGDGHNIHGQYPHPAPSLFKPPGDRRSDHRQQPCRPPAHGICPDGRTGILHKVRRPPAAAVPFQTASRIQTENRQDQYPEAQT